MNKQNTGADRVMTGFSRNWIEYNSKHLWEVDDKGNKKNVHFTSDMIFMGDGQQAPGWIDGDQTPFYDGTPVPKPTNDTAWDTPGVKIAQAIIYESLTTASLPPLKVKPGDPKSKSYAKRREKDRQEALDWLYADNEEDDMICLHTFNNCCSYLNVSPQKIRDAFEASGRNIRVSMHNSYNEWPEHSQGR